MVRWLFEMVFVVELEEWVGVYWYCFIICYVSGEFEVVWVILESMWCLFGMFFWVFGGVLGVVFEVILVCCLLLCCIWL